jgi:phage terminase small subunit
MGVLTEADGQALYLMATVQAEVEELEQFLIDNKRTYETSSRYCDNLIKVRPEVAQLAAARTLLRSLIAEFGGTPASRARVETTDGNAGKSNPWDKLKNRGR